MNEIVNVNERKTITTLEIAEMMEVSHKEILRKLDGGNDRKGYVPIMTENQMVLSEYFIGSVYKDGSGKSNKCYEVTKLGCDFLANKFTGEKGILFTAKYVKRFRDMEIVINSSEQLKASLLLSIYTGGQDGVLATRQLVDMEVKEATTPLLSQIEEQKPMVDFHNAVNTSDNSVSFGKFSGIIQNDSHITLGRTKLMQWCRNKSYLCSSNELWNKPSQQMIQNGYMQYKENVVEKYSGNITTYTPLITGKGQVFLTKKILKEFCEK